MVRISAAASTRIGTPLALAMRRHRLDAELALVGVGTGQHVDHRRPRPERRLELGDGRHRDDAHADGAHRGVVDVARVRRDDHLVLGEPLQVRDADVELGVAAGDAGGGRVGQPGRAAGRDQAPLGLGQLGQARADRLGQLVEVDVALRLAASIAARTSGSIVEPLMMVKVPRALISGRTPIDW